MYRISMANALDSFVIYPYDFGLLAINQDENQILIYIL